MLTAILMLSCGDTSLLFPEIEEEPDTTIETIAHGAVLEPGDPISFIVDRSNINDEDLSTPDRMLVEIVDVDGEVVATQTFESVDLLQQIPPIIVPELGSGYFELLISYSDGDALIAEERVPFFITTGWLSIGGVSTYPTSFYPGSQGLVELRATIPEGTDPFVRWRFEGEEIASGYVSAGADRALVTSPSRDGVYSLSVELFPSGPAEEERFEFESAISYETQLFVTRERTLAETDLSPEGHYLTLFHLQGDFRDSGVRDLFEPNVPMVATTLGAPQLRLEDDIFGYYLDGDSGFSVAAALLPYLDSDLSAFSLTLRLRPAALGEQDRIVLVEDVSGNELMSLSSNAAGELRISLQTQSGIESAVSGSPLLTIGESTTISVSVLPGAESTQVLWFADGLLASVSSLSPINAPAEVAETEDDEAEWSLRPGRTVIGGGPGFTGVVDEVGVYFRDEGDRPSSDESIFADAMALTYGDSLVYAEGFETQELPRELLAYGDVRIDSGQLSIGSQGGVVLPRFPFGDEELIVEIDLPESDPTAEVRVSVAAGEADAEDTESQELGEGSVEEESQPPAEADLQPFLIVLGDGTVGEDAATKGDDSATLRFAIALVDGEIVAHAPDGTALASVPIGGGGELELEIANVGDADLRVRVRSVLVHRGEPQLADRFADEDRGEE